MYYNLLTQKSIEVGQDDFKSTDILNICYFSDEPIVGLSNERKSLNH